MTEDHLPTSAPNDGGPASGPCGVPSSALGGDWSLADAQRLRVDPSQPPPRLLLYDPREDRGHAAVRTLRSSLRDVQIDLLTVPTPALVVGKDSDLAIVNIGAGNFAGLSLAAEFAAAAPWIQTLFCFDERNEDAAAAVVRHLGMGPVIPSGALASWLGIALPTLVRMSRASRIFVEAKRQLPPPPVTTAPLLPLAQAERDFREIYLRRLLSESSNNAEAARRAGLPYTTLCSMVKKLGL